MREQTISSEKVYEGRILELFVEEVQIHQDKVAIREIVRHKGAVCALAVTPNDKIVLVKQFRKATEEFLLEIPAGKLEANEMPLEAIRRELKEETGYITNSIEYMTEFYTSPGFCDEKIFLYFAQLGEKQEQELDEDEFVEIFEYRLDRLQQMVKNGEIRDAKTILAISLYSIWKEDNK